MSEELASTNDKLTQFRLETIETTLSKISDNLSTLTRLEEKHGETRIALERAFASISKTDERVRNIETEMPTLKLVRKWVIGGVVSGIGLMLAGLFKLYTLNLPH